LSNQLTPNVVCNAGDTENAGLQTMVVLHAATDAGAFSPLPINVLTPDAGLDLPDVTLTSPSGQTIPVRRLEFVSTTEIHVWITRDLASMPLTPGNYRVTVTNPNGSSASVDGAIRITAPPTLTSVTRTMPPVPMPPADPMETRVVCNGTTTTLALHGSNFRPSDPKPVVQLVDAMGNLLPPLDSADVTVVSDTEIDVVLRAPASPEGRLAPGAYGFRVTNPDGLPTMGFPQGCHITVPDLVTVVPPPDVLGVEPVAVCGSRMNSFVVSGAHFRAGAVVSFGMPATYTATAANTMLQMPSMVNGLTEYSQITVSVPAGSLAPGNPYAVNVANADGCSGSLAPACPAGATPTTVPGQCADSMNRTGPQHVTVYPDPTITAVMPMQICAGGNAMVTISGTGFHSTYGALPTVTINGMALTNVAVVNDTTITATLPMPMAGGPFDVTVTLPEGCSATASMSFTVSPAPIVAAILPSRGWNMIDMPVTILGDGLAGTTGVVLVGAGPGGADWPLTDVQVVDAFTINATVPAGAIAGGPYDVRVVSSGACNSVLPAAFTVTDTPSLTITQVIPPFGWTGTSTPVTIRGTMFQSTPRAYLVVPSRTPRLVPLRNTVFVSSTVITATVPSGLPVGGPYDLVVINPDGGGGLLSMAFRVTANPVPVIDTLSPQQSTTASPTSITITGSGYRNTPSAPDLWFYPANGTAPTTTCTPPTCFPAAGVSVASGGTTITATVPTNTMTAGVSYIVRVTDTDENTYGEYGTFVVTNPASNLGTFTTTNVPTLTTARRGLGATSLRINGSNRFIYAVAGDTGTTGTGANSVLDSVEFAQLDIFGALTAWQQQRYRLNTARTRIGIAREGRCMYAVGGSSTIATSTPLASVERACLLTFDDAPVVSDPVVMRAASGGLAMGSWLYRVSAVMAAADAFNPNGETLPSDEVVATLVRNSTVTLSWTAVPGAASYRVYRSPMVNGVSGTETLLADAVSATMFTDDGSLTPAAADLDHTPLKVGSTGVWTNVAMLVHARDGAGVTLAPDPSGALFMYALGGNGDCTGGTATAPMACAEFASLSTDGASLGAWTATSGALNTPRWSPGATYASALVGETRNFPALTGGPVVYVTAGTTGAAGATALNTTEFARVVMGGDLAAFTNTTRSYSGGAGGALEAAVINSTFYAFGGTTAAPNSTGLSSVKSGPPANTGDITTTLNNSGMMVSLHGNYGLADETAYFFVIGGTTTGTDAVTTVEQVIH
jgi:hypothetical protein